MYTRYLFLCKKPSQIQWLKTTTMYLSQDFMSQQSGLGSAGASSGFYLGPLKHLWLTAQSARQHCSGDFLTINYDNNGPWGSHLPADFVRLMEIVVVWFQEEEWKHARILETCAQNRHTMASNTFSESKQVTRLTQIQPRDGNYCQVT